MAKGEREVGLASHAILILVLIIGLVGSSCWLAYALHRAHSTVSSDSLTPHQIEARARQDPPVGSAVSLEGLRDSAGRPVQIGPNGLLLLFVAGPKLSNCSTCGTEEFISEFNALARSQPGTPAYVVWAGQQDLKGLEVSRNPYDSVQFALDPKLGVSARVNAFFFPRAYVIGDSGELRYLSPYGEETSVIIREMQRALAAGGD